MRTLLAVPLVLSIVATASAQQIGSVDLTRAREHKALQNGCKKLSPGLIGDGWPEPEDHLPRDIAVEVISVRERNPALGSQLAAQVRLLNSGTRQIEIPWSTEFSTVERGQSPDALQWDVGTFEFALKDRQGHKVPLKSLPGAVYGSKSSVGSELTVKPGESIVALVKFMLEEEFPIPPLRLKEGEWQLSARWVQTGRTLSVGKDCSAANAYFHYDRYYKQQNPGITIQVNTGGPTTSRKPPG
jgi:hypothetical protein